MVDRNKIVDGSKVGPGDVLIGMESNGLHTNGYSLARHILFDSANYRVDQYIEELGMTLGEELLKPHKSYAIPVHTLLSEFDIHGMAHITGGGFYDNIPRALPTDCQAAVERRNWETPRIFRIIQELGDVSEPEMYRTFNMGIGYVLVVPKELATTIIARLSELGEKSCIIGEVRKGSREVQVI
jgi:phosphoribosylformylglycinamidine cyclo-ligase